MDLPPTCLPVEIAVASAMAVTRAVNGNLFLLVDPAEIARYKSVVDTFPPPSGDADKLLIVVAPAGDALMVVIKDGRSCEHHNIHRDLHARAWRQARGTEI